MKYNKAKKFVLRDKDIYKMRVKQRLTLEEIAGFVGLTKQRISQIINNYPHNHLTNN